MQGEKSPFERTNFAREKAFKLLITIFFCINCGQICIVLYNFWTKIQFLLQFCTNFEQNCNFCTIFEWKCNFHLFLMLFQLSLETQSIPQKWVKNESKMSKNESFLHENPAPKNLVFVPNPAFLRLVLDAFSTDPWNKINFWAKFWKKCRKIIWT